MCFPFFGFFHFSSRDRFSSSKKNKNIKTTLLLIKGKESTESGRRRRAGRDERRNVAPDSALCAPFSLCSNSFWLWHRSSSGSKSIRPRPPSSSTSTASMLSALARARALARAPVSSLLFSLARKREEKRDETMRLVYFLIESFLSCV